MELLGPTASHRITSAGSDPVLFTGLKDIFLWTSEKVLLYISIIRGRVRNFFDLNT